MDGSCVRCGQNIPSWLTFTLGRGGRVFCSEHCQRLDEQSREVSDALREVTRHTPSDAVEGDVDGRDASEGAGEVASRRRRFLSRLR